MNAVVLLINDTELLILQYILLHCLAVFINSGLHASQAYVVMLLIFPFFK